MSKVDDWQNVCKDNKSRVEHVLQNKILTDCQFLVGPESDKAVTIRGHKLILAMASPVFERMFYGLFDGQQSNKIRIPDIKQNIFHIMMDYIYFEKLDLKTVDDAFELYTASKKYMLQHLMTRCIHYLSSHRHRSPANVWKIYEFAVFFEEHDLMAKCGDYMAMTTLKVLKDPSFVDANLNTVIALLEREHLNIRSEMDLFHALNKYALANGYFDAKNSLEKKELESDIEKKKLIKEAVKKIRFLCLLPEELAIVANSKLLTDSEVLSIIANKLSPSVTNRPMPEGFSISKTSRRMIGKFN